MGDPGQLLRVNGDGSKLEFIEKDVLISELQIFDSQEAANMALGADKLFRYSKGNIEGVVSPNNDAVGKT